MIVRVVEDNEDIAYMLGIFSQDWPNVEMRFTLAHFGNLLTPEPWKQVDAALIDYHLAEPITGHTISEYLRLTHPHVRRVILTAALLDGSSLWERLRNSAHIVLSKPMTSDEVAAALGVFRGRPS